MEKKITNIQQILPLLESVVKLQVSLFIVAEDVESKELIMFVVNKFQDRIKICAVKAPSFSSNSKGTMQDLPVLTSRIVVSEEFGMKLEEVTLDKLGKLKKNNNQQE